MVAIDPAQIRVVPVCFCCSCCATLIFAVVALPLSFKSLEQGFYALQLNWSTQKISDEVLVEPGMNMVGLGNMLLEFPSTFQTMYFVSDRGGVGDDSGEVVRGPIRARSQDGLEMRVSMSFQWKLSSDALKPLYKILGHTLYKDEFVRFARGSIVRSCSKFTANKFFTNRTLITEQMLSYMEEAFNKPEMHLAVMIKGLQLREVDLPDAFDREIAATQEQMQEREVAIAEREEQRTNMLREVMVAEMRVNRTIETALGEAEGILLENEAFVNQTINFNRQQAFANAAIVAKFSNDAQPYQRLFEVMELDALNIHQSEQLFFNMQR